MIEKNQKLLLLGKKRYLVEVEERSFSTEFGEIDLGELIGKEPGVEIKSHLGEEFVAVEPFLPDVLKKIKRGPQIITLKDAGLIVSLAGINKESKVVEAGAGSGHLTAFLAKIAKEVHSYEKRNDFYDIAKENLEQMELENVELKNQDIKNCEVENVDAFILDLGSPEKHVETAESILKPGGYLIIYSPVIEQVQRLDLEGFEEVRTVECILRDWNVGNNKTRPKTRSVGHTGFLTFARKV